ncbi:MAG: peptidoglycan-associated lipoprotein Pal [Paracoccaceae bacterium]
MLRSLMILAALATLGACARQAEPNPLGGTVPLDAFPQTSPAPAAPSAPVDPASDPTSPQYFARTIGDRVLFPVDTSTLTTEARATLDAQAGWLSTNTGFDVVVEGHADEQGTREYNLALGARRSNAVKEYLVSRGIPEARMRTVSFGKERPAAICSEESCYARNRRAVTILSVGVGS